MPNNDTGLTAFLARLSSGSELLTSLGFDYLLGKGRKTRPVAETEEETQRLHQFHEIWSPLATKFDNRYIELNNYSLVVTMKSLKGQTRKAYIEALACFLFGQDLASSNMICVAIEALLREVANDSKSHLVEIVDRVAKEKKLSAHLARDLHFLRKIRNVHSHSIKKLEELDLLKLFKTVGDLVKELGYGG